MKQIKIVYILGTLDIGGTETQFLETLRRIDRTRFTLRVLAFPCHGPLLSRIQSLDIPVTCVDFQGVRGKFHPAAFFQLFRLFRKMVRYFRQEQPDIVQSYLFWANIYGCLAAKIADVPVILTGRRGLTNTGRMKWHYQWLQYLSNRWATMIIANSQAVRTDCLQYERGVSPQKIRVIYNGIQIRSGCPSQRNSLRKAFNLPDKSPVIGIIANLRPCKGHHTFLRAAAIVLQAYPQTKFLIIGRDDGVGPSLNNLAQTLGIQHAIVFTGERSDIPDVLSLLTLQVSASSSESLSNAILEGMADGIPVIATDVGGNPELVNHEKTGLLVASDNPQQLSSAIIRLLKNPTERQQFGMAGKNKIEREFQIDQKISRMETIYQQLVMKR